MRAGSALTIRAGSSSTPITPVELGRTCAAGTFSDLATARLVIKATLSPVRVAQLAVPDAPHAVFASDLVDASREQQCVEHRHSCRPFVVDGPQLVGRRRGRHDELRDPGLAGGDRREELVTTTRDRVHAVGDSDAFLEGQGADRKPRGALRVGATEADGQCELARQVEIDVEELGPKDERVE